MNRVLVIGVDSADADLIDRWSAEGDLPAFARLRAEGAWGRLATPADVMHVSAWPTLYTGVGPGHHGLYHAYQTRAGLRGVERARPERIGAAPFWVDLDRAGRRALVMDAFMTAPARGFGGVEIVDYGTWTWFGEPRVAPRRLGREIARRFGSYPAPEHLEVLDVPDPVWFRDRLVRGIRAKTEIVEWLMAEQAWDVTFVTFGEPHGAGHYLWHHDDPGYPCARHRTAAAPHPLRDVYVAVDGAVGRLLDRVDDDVTVLVVSADGMGPNHAGAHHVPEMLHRLDLFHGAGVGEPSGGTASRSGGGLSRVRKLVPMGLRQTASRCMPRRWHYRLSMRWANEAVDWDRTRAFAIPNSNEGYIRLRRQGRDPGGVETEETCAALLSELETVGRSLRNPETERAAAARVVRVDESFPGPRRPDLPDLVIAWDESARLGGRLHGDGIGTVEGVAGFETAPFYTGNHRPAAFVAARGPGVAAGSTFTGHVADLAPTVLALQGVAVPDRYEGAPWGQVVP